MKKKIRKYPLGTKRWSKSFAFFPKEIEGHKVWLQSYYTLCRYSVYGYDGFPYAWIVIDTTLELPEGETLNGIIEVVEEG